MTETNKNPGIDKYIEAFNEGDESAFKHIHDHFFNRLHFFAYKLTANKEEGWDITSKIMAKLWKKRKDFKTYLNIKAFLYISTRNACINYLKKHASETNRHKIFYNNQEELDQESKNVLYSSELIQALRAAIEEIPEKQREVLKLWLNEVPTEEIAHQVNTSTGSVYGLKMRGIESLRVVFKRKKLNDLVILLAILEHFNKNNF